MTRLFRAVGWLAVLALVVLASRALAYALVPSPLAVELRRSAGGPRPVVVALVAIGLAVAFAVAVLWLAVVAVGERHRLRHKGPPPRLRLARLLVRAVALSLASCLTFAMVESYLHWRAGLGFHGLHCLAGPVHRNAIPILVALSLLAAAAVGALEHVVRWMRMAVDVLREARSRRASPAPLLATASLRVDAIEPLLLLRRARPRAPPHPEPPVHSRRLAAAAT